MADNRMPDLSITVTAPRPPVANRPATPPKVVSRTETPPDRVNTPSEALQTAKPVNTPIIPAYLLMAKVLVNGFDLGPPISLEVSTNGYYQADRYYVELATTAMDPAHREKFWSSGEQKRIELRVQRGNEASNSLILGAIDDTEIDWLNRKIKLRGRDLTSLLLDNKTAEKFPNKTSSQVAETIAVRRGLSAKITKTTTIVGTYFQREHAKLTMDISEHDLLTFLAEKEGFNYWVKGTTLHFEKPPPDDTKPFVINYTPPTATSMVDGTFIALSTKRNETMAKDIEVKVISYEGKKQTPIVATATRSRVKPVGTNSRVTRSTVGGNISGVSKQLYVFRVNGLNKAQLQDKANKLADEISKHERTVICEMPYDPIIDARSRVSLRGTGTEFDQAYFVDSIEYSFSADNGSRMEIHMRNTSPQSQVSIV